jgi:hypothetical protein
MKHSTFRPFVFVAILVLVVGLACGIDFGTKPTEAGPEPIVPATQPPVEQASPIPPTEAAPTAVPPTDTPVPVSPFFKETFDTDVLGNWVNFIKKDDPKSDDSKAKIYIENGKLVFDITDNYLYSYLIYDKQTYEDVRVEVSVDNRGKNNNNVSLICRYSKDGWYEFNIASNGLFNILAYDATNAVHKGYNALVTDGSNAIKMGKETNVYVAVCSGKTLSLYINGEESASFTDNRFGFNDGKVGFSVSSFNVYPIIIELDYFDIQQP